MEGELGRTHCRSAAKDLLVGVCTHAFLRCCSTLNNQGFGKYAATGLLWPQVIVIWGATKLGQTLRIAGPGDTAVTNIYTQIARRHTREADEIFQGAPSRGILKGASDRGRQVAKKYTISGKGMKKRPIFLL